MRLYVFIALLVVGGFSSNLKADGAAVPGLETCLAGVVVGVPLYMPNYEAYLDESNTLHHGLLWSINFVFADHEFGNSSRGIFHLVRAAYTAVNDRDDIVRLSYQPALYIRTGMRYPDSGIGSRFEKGFSVGLPVGGYILPVTLNDNKADRNAGVLTGLTLDWIFLSICSLTAGYEIRYNVSGKEYGGQSFNVGLRILL